MQNLQLIKCVQVAIAQDADIVTARQRGRELASELGFYGRDLTVIATAVSEVARNIVEYAGCGEVLLSSVSQDDTGGQGIEVIAQDEGPGIPDISQALQDGFSTRGGLGMGLPGAKRLMDEFEITSQPGKGTKVTMRKWLH